ncbi:hypothetical protein MKW92_000886, partial [Papaver armeniacum]
KLTQNTRKVFEDDQHSDDGQSKNGKAIDLKIKSEVGDVKRMNWFGHRLQMSGLKSLHIPLPGRHPPSCCLSNNSPTHRNW